MTNIPIRSAIKENAGRSNLLNNLARLKGFEPLTHCLEGSCSIRLSYRRT